MITIGVLRLDRPGRGRTRAALRLPGAAPAQVSDAWLGVDGVGVLPACRIRAGHDETPKIEEEPMKFIIVLLLIAIAVLVFLKMTGRLNTGKEEKKGSFRARPIATANEQKMFWRLITAFGAPEYIVLTQVSFGALLIAKDGASRYSFAQKRADFVLLNKGFKVLAVIELDDSSHKGREANDASRDAMLKEAGYKVLRYSSIPEAEKLASDLGERKP